MDDKKKASDFIEFYIGLLMMAGGIFFLLSKAVVYSNHFGFTIGGITLSSGIVVIPLMIGIVWLMNKPKSIFAKVLTLSGAVFIIASIMLSIRIMFTTTTYFDYVVMIVLLAAGLGLVIRTYMMAREINDKNREEKQ